MTKLKGKKAAITGKFKSAPRKELKARLEKLGIAVSSSVSKKTDFLVAGAKAGSKMTKAYENSVPILSEGYLNMLLNEDGIPLEEALMSMCASRIGGGGGQGDESRDACHFEVTAIDSGII